MRNQRGFVLGLFLLAHQPIILAIGATALMFTNVGQAIITTINLEQKVQSVVKDEEAKKQ